jgi:hypothetical protein
MRLRRILISSLCVAPVLLALYALLSSDYGELPDDPAASLASFVFPWAGALVLWPFFLHGCIWQHEAHGVIWLSLFLLAALFWGFMFELIFMLKIRLWPNKSPEPTPVGAASPPSRALLSVPAWLSFGR